MSGGGIVLEQQLIGRRLKWFDERRLILSTSCSRVGTTDFQRAQIEASCFQP
jgi:hypothetical protein